jgi:hypothetical protein
VTPIAVPFTGLANTPCPASATKLPFLHVNGSPWPRPFGRRPLLRGGEAGRLLPPLCRFDFSGFFFDQLDEVVDDVGVFQAVVGQAVDVHLVGAVAAAGKADVGFAPRPDR